MIIIPKYYYTIFDGEDSRYLFLTIQVQHLIFNRHLIKNLCIYDTRYNSERVGIIYCVLYVVLS